MLEWQRSFHIKKVTERCLTTEVTHHPIGSLFKVIPKASSQEVFCFLAGESLDEAEMRPLGNLKGVRAGDPVIHVMDRPGFAFDDRSIGEVVDATGHIISTGIQRSLSQHYLPLDPAPLSPMSRGIVDRVFETGIRAIDGLLTMGVGQRMGLFAGTGVGKSVLISMIAQYSTADIVVIGLIGERGREVKEFVEQTIQPEQRDRFVIVASPADDYPAKRVQAAKAATAIAEKYRDEGKNVLLLIDSLTRYAQALREVALADGDLPAARGYPPRVFYDIPRLVERSGKTEKGSITGIYTVLAEGDDLNDPIVDASRGVLDGHVVLSRELAIKGIFPAIDISQSISRLMYQLVPDAHREKAQEMKSMFGQYQDYRDMEVMGSLDKKNKEAKRVLSARKDIESFILQDMKIRYTYTSTIEKLMETDI